MSRLLISKETVGSTIVPTLIHFIITIILFVPFFGWIIYLIGTVYYMVKNYKLAVVPNVNK